jgi:hypothetical protein
MRVRGGSSVAVAAALALTGAVSSSEGRDEPGASQAIVNARAGKVVAASIADVERMCALLISCDDVAIPPSLFPQDFAACVTSMTGDLASPGAVAMSLAIRECARTASSCGELRSCALRGASDDACAGRGKRAAAGVCDADGRALTCWHDRVFAVRDCPRGGESCRVVDGEAMCTLGACAAAPPTRPRRTARLRGRTCFAARRASSRASTARRSASRAPRRTAPPPAPRPGPLAPARRLAATEGPPSGASTGIPCASTARRRG